MLTLRDEGAGRPDGGVFTADQLGSEVEDPLAHVLSARGVSGPMLRLDSRPAGTGE